MRPGSQHMMHSHEPDKARYFGPDHGPPALKSGVLGCCRWYVAVIDQNPAQEETARVCAIEAPIASSDMSFIPAPTPTVGAIASRALPEKTDLYPTLE